MSRIAAIVMAAIIAVLGALGVFLKVSHDKQAELAATLTAERDRERAGRDQDTRAYLKQVRDKNDQIRDLNTALGEMDDLRTLVGQLRQQVKSHEASAETARAKAEGLGSTLAEAVEARDRALRELEQMRNDREELVARFTEAKREAEDAVAAVRKVEGEKTALAGQLAESQLEHDALRSERDRFQDIAARPAGVQITGKVEEELDSGKVVISALNEKPEVNLDLSVLQEGEFIGRVRVYKVFENLAGAQVTYLLPGKRIRSGDVVCTGFPER